MNFGPRMACWKGLAAMRQLIPGGSYHGSAQFVNTIRSTGTEIGGENLLFAENAKSRPPALCWILGKRVSPYAGRGAEK